MSQAQKIETMFSDISDFISESKRLLASDALLELAGLDEKVERLCHEVLQLSPEERVKYAAHLDKSFADLKDLGEQMKKHRDNMSAGIKNIPNHQRASSAYLKTNATGYKKEE